MTGLPAPGDVLGTPALVLSTDRVAALVREAWGLRAGTVRPLTSERDVNVLLDGRYVLEVSNPAEDPAVVDMENTIGSTQKMRRAVLSRLSGRSG